MHLSYFLYMNDSLDKRIERAVTHPDFIKKVADESRTEKFFFSHEYHLTAKANTKQRWVSGTNMVGDHKQRPLARNVLLTFDLPPGKEPKQHPYQ